MGYVPPVKGPITYTPSTAIVANSAAQVIVNTSAWIKYKEIILTQYIGPNSKFEFYFEIQQAGIGANLILGKTYRNGVAIGSQFQTDATLNVIKCTETLTATNWVIGDLVQLYCWANAAAGYCKNLQLHGLGSEWEVVT